MNLTRESKATGVLLGLLLVLTVMLTGCQNGVTGPALTVSVQNVSLQPTVAGLVGAENVCCCHIAGTLVNTSSIAIHAELVFRATRSDGSSAGTALNIQSDVPPGGSRTFLAVGINAACSAVKLSQITANQEIRLKGIFQPEA